MPRFQGFRVPRSQGLKVPGFQFRGSKVSGFQGSRVPGFQGFRVPGFQGSFRILKAASPREPAPALEIETQQALLLGTSRRQVGDKWKQVEDKCEDNCAVTRGRQAEKQ